MPVVHNIEIVVIGAGVAGIATAYYLCTEYGKRSVLIVDSRQPMSFTSAQSGDNYRNWWPHPTMVEFTNSSIDLMERIAVESSNVLQMTRGGYAAASRNADIDELIGDLYAGYGSADPKLIRVHTEQSAHTYRNPTALNWMDAPDGVDVISNRQLIRRTFPSFSKEITNVIHIRRAGEISSQQMAQFMLRRISEAGGKRLRAQLKGVSLNGGFELEVEGPDGIEIINAEAVVNAAGPFAKDVAAMLGVDLPIRNVFQQKIAFEDRCGAIPRAQPFSIDLDDQKLKWTTEERELLAEDPDMQWLLKPISGGVHCRPEGGATGSWVKLGWAYNEEASEPKEEPVNDTHFDPQFPEIVLRGATALNPALGQYIESFPSRCSHYGGYYPMTLENWPLIGPLGVDGAFVTGALSGFGSMSACAAGALCASWIGGGDLPSYANQLSLARYDDKELMAEIENLGDKGIL
jgi:glycine/D-amino acid oxidase-like deaminating enzyme